MHCAVHMQLGSQVLPRSYSEGWKLPSDWLILLLWSACRSVWGPKLFSPNPIDLVLWLLKQPTAQFHAFLSERLCTVCPHGHGRWSPEACKLSSVASCKCTRKFLPPSHLPKIPWGDIQTPLMSFGRDCSQPMSKSIWWSG